MRSTEEAGTQGPVVPSAAQLLLDFLNTVEYQERTDSLMSPNSLRTWCMERGLIQANARLTSADVHRAVVIREGLRAAFHGHAGHSGDKGELERMNVALAKTPLRVSFDMAGEPSLVAMRAENFDGALGG